MTSFSLIVFTNLELDTTTFLVPDNEITEEEFDILICPSTFTADESDYEFVEAYEEIQELLSTPKYQKFLVDYEPNKEDISQEYYLDMTDAAYKVA